MYHAGNIPNRSEKIDVIVIKYIVSREYSNSKLSHRYWKFDVSILTTLKIKASIGKMTNNERKTVEKINFPLFVIYFLTISNLFYQIYELLHLFWYPTYLDQQGLF